jgi:cytoskeletal protein RodZ
MLASRRLRRRASGIEGRRNGRYRDVVPETRGERIIFAIGALAIAALVALIVLEAATDRFDTPHKSAVAAQLTVAATTEAAASTSPAISTAREITTAPGATTGETAAAAATGIARLTLSAVANTWVEIRSGSADGDVLYSGILPQGTAKHFRSTHLWASFGAAANLTARLNGKPLHLPPGTYSALVGARGLKPLVG